MRKGAGLKKRMLGRLLKRTAKRQCLLLLAAVLFMCVSACGAANKEEAPISETDAAAASSEVTLAVAEEETSTLDAAQTETEPAEDPAAEEQAFRKTHEIAGLSDLYTAYHLSFERDGMRIYGQLFLPEDDLTSHPLVIIGHGLGSSYADCIPDAEYFANAGIAAYVFDFCGGSVYSESDGDFYDMSVLTEKADMQTVFDGLRSLPFFDPNRIFLMGESQGGLVAALLAKEQEADVAGLIMFFPGFQIPDGARAWFGDASQIPADPSEVGAPLGYRYYRDTIDMDPYEEACAYKKDVLIVHGDADEVVPLSYSERAAEEYPHAELVVSQGAGHGFFGDALEEACGQAVAFVKRH